MSTYTATIRWTRKDGGDPITAANENQAERLVTLKM